MSKPPYPAEVEALPEGSKEYDRVLARYILEREASLRAVVKAARSFTLPHKRHCDCSIHRALDALEEPSK